MSSLLGRLWHYAKLDLALTAMQVNFPWDGLPNVAKTITLSPSQARLFHIS